MSDEGYVWETSKYEEVQRRHGVSLLEAIEVSLDARQLVDDDPQGNAGRFMIVGKTRKGRLLQVVCSTRSMPVLRFVTAFDASPYWRKEYERE